MAKTSVEVCLDPIELETEDLEDVLVTDPLFVDYLNHYLSLPIFPEKIQFNSKSGAFEINDSSADDLTDKLRTLIRSQRKSAPIYKATRNHSYREIPLINLDGEDGPLPEEIDTTLKVKTLNKEQGVGWIKKERFSLFLKSDCYLQYRLAKIIAQARVKDEEGKNVAMVALPSRPPSRRIPREEEQIQTEVQQADDRRIMQQCYVSLGNTSQAETEAWVSTAMRAHQTYTISTRTAPVCSAKIRPQSARPSSTLSMMEKSRMSADSGISSPTKSLSSYTTYSERPDSCVSRTNTPRPTEAVCVIGDSMVNNVQTAAHVEVKGNKSVAEEEKDSNKTIQCNDTDQLASVITGTVLKYSIAEVTGQNLDDVAKNSVVTDILPGKAYHRLSLDDLKRMSLEPASEPRPPFVPTDEKDKDSDEDSLMKSDDEYEDERDRHFRRKFTTHPVGSLGRMKSVEDFRKFLTGTAGELLWNLWLDIDRLCIGTSHDEINRALYEIRAKYSTYNENRAASSGLAHILRDWDSRKWTMEQLQKLKRDLAKRILLYWAPRYMMTAHKRPNHRLYTVKNTWNVVSSGRRSPAEAFPNPRIRSPLPLRPKSCLPRRTGERIDVMARPCSQEGSTPGFKRTYAPSALQYAYGRVPDLEELLQKAELKRSEEAEQTPATPNLKQRPKSASAKIRSSAGKTRPSSSASTESVFLGGRRLERLLQALSRESLSGAFFRRFAEKSGNLVWKNAILYWTDLQKYHELFYSDAFDSYKIDRLAKHLYSTYIVEGSLHNIQCSAAIKRQIHREMNPPFEELFDGAEEYCLVVLHEAWKEMIKNDSVGFTKVEQVEVSRSFHSKNKELLAIQAKGLIKQKKKEEEEESDEESMEEYQDPVYDPELILKVKEEFREMTLDKLVLNRIELEYFRQFLADNYASMDLLCWMDIEAFRRIPHSDEAGRDTKAKMIKTKYLTKKYFFGPNSPAGKESQNKIMEICGGWGKLLDDRPPTQVLLETQKHVRDRLEKKWLPLFLMTPEFEGRQNPPVKMDEVVDDVLVQKRKQSASVSKMLESRWLSSSKEIITFRNALLNPVTSAQFRRYVSLRGEFLENDVLFWREVQMFKNMYHLHNEDSAIQSKISAIITCFIDSQIPPSLQIDIRTDQADKIIDKRRELGPYVFRDAQLTVFRVLMPFWEDFCEYRKGISDETLAIKLEKQKRRQKAKLKRLPPSDKESSKKSSARSGSSDGSVKSGAGAEEGGEEEALPEEVEQRNKVQWTYSNYLECLQREEMLNRSEYSSSISSLV